MTDALTTTNTTLDLTDLATQANKLHAACEAAAQSMILAARDCGDALLKAKAIVGHGRFTCWIRANCRFSDRMARKYMTLAKGWDELAKRNHGSVLESVTMREALRILASGSAGDDGLLVLVDMDCPSCGQRMARTSFQYATCTWCWDCRLHGIPPHLRKIRDKSSVPNGPFPIGHTEAELREVKVREAAESLRGAVDTLADLFAPKIGEPAFTAQELVAELRVWRFMANGFRCCRVRELLEMLDATTAPTVEEMTARKVARRKQEPKEGTAA